jgi:hypothetical protein
MTRRALHDTPGLAPQPTNIAAAAGFSVARGGHADDRCLFLGKHATARYGGARYRCHNTRWTAGRTQKDRARISRALLLGYYTDDAKLIYAGRVGTGMPVKVLANLRRRLDPLVRKTPPLNVLPPRKTRFGSPLVLSRVHWVEPSLSPRSRIWTWTADNLLRHTVYVGGQQTKFARRRALTD